MAKTALAEKLGSLLPKLQRKWQFAEATANSGMTWTHPDIGDFVVNVRNGTVGKTRHSEGYSWALINTGASRMPGMIDISFATNFTDDVRLVLQARGNEVVRSYGRLEGLKVPVEWDGDRPKTRVKDQDNLDHFVVTGKCVVLQLQTSVLTRSDSFFICNHELWATEIVEVTDAEPSYYTYEHEGKFYAAVNLWDNQAYPGADFLLTNQKTAGKVIVAMLEEGLVPRALEVREEAEWNPPAFPQREGFTGAIVLWFNPNIGAKVLCADGTQQFVPLKGIQTVSGETVMWQGGFPIVTPKQQVLLRVMNPKKGQSFATIRPVD